MADRPPPAGDDTWLLHLYRSLSSEMLMWRTRLDVTARWAVPLLTALITVALGELRIPHTVLLVLGVGVIAVATGIEGRRFQQMRHAQWRCGLIESEFFARKLTGTTDTADARWRERLAADLREPHPVIGVWTALQLRMRRLYLVLLYLLVLAWVAKIVIHPGVSDDWPTLVDRMGVGAVISGQAVAASVGTLLALATIMSVVPYTRHTSRRFDRAGRDAGDRSEPTDGPRRTEAEST